MTVFGTRPEAIKLAPVIRELERRPEFESTICVTGQHREMLDQMLQLFGIEPDYDLNVMRHDQSPTDVTVAVLAGLRRVLEIEVPDWVLVQGDTTTTMAGGLGAFHHGCRVAHVEAGLRSFDTLDPWPEEMNRRVAGVVADLHFAPTGASAENLFQEGISKDRVFVTGNTVIDALNAVAALPFEPERTPLADVPVEGRRVIVATMHRRELTPVALEDVCRALESVARAHDDVHIVVPVHRNPNVHGPVHALLGGVPNVTLLPPLEYQPMVWLLRRSCFVVTDSGGLQEEVTALGKPVLVIRATTERPESIEAGNAVLVGTDRHTIETWATRLLTDGAVYGRMARATNAYGDGDAARRIVDILARRTRRRAPRASAGR
ncbi:MAG TPA: UDP-N-acetylglucosamine 2-epimerase (non-hydrolyzing) [Gaiellaceae bacterium]|nr:UDP-N-acetylglucosamine 2-epimerase (non-hydrolyzing) [Gaiellaceae bacterium]